MNVDVLVVGAGYAGAVLAERFHDLGKRVLIIDKRNHIGGNAYDEHDKYGVLVHRYGPHYFSTNHKSVVSYLSRFTSWIPERYKVRIFVRGKYYTFPINRSTLNEFFGLSLATSRQAEVFLKNIREDIPNPQNAEEQILATAGRQLYNAFFKNYTKKQWGMDPKLLDASVTARIPIRTSLDDRYSSRSFQGLPKHGYTHMFKNMIRGIPLLLNTPYQEIKGKIRHKLLIYTGPIDEYFSFRYGRLPYRSLRFEFKTYKKAFHQKWFQINYPNNYKYTRSVEIKHLTKQQIPYTTVSYEYPQESGDPYYPVPSPSSRTMYEKYKVLAEKKNSVYFVGRLAEYRYINMDDVVKSALSLFRRIRQLV